MVIVRMITSKLMKAGELNKLCKQNKIGESIKTIELDVEVTRK